MNVHSIEKNKIHFVYFKLLRHCFFHPRFSGQETIYRGSFLDHCIVISETMWSIWHAGTIHNSSLHNYYTSHNKITQ